MMRVAIIFAVVVALFAPFNVVAVRLLTRLHPRRRRIVFALAILCNLMWLFLPMLNARTDFSRVVRAVLGPPWFAWLAFVIIYSLVIALLLMAWIPFHKRTTFDDFARRPSRLFLWFVVIGGGVGVYQALVPLRVEHVPVHIPGVARTKLVLIADLHTGLFSRPSRLETIFRVAAEQKPDAILLAGDLIDDDPYFTPKLIAATSVVPPSIPILATLGNHETYGAPLEHIAKMRGSRIRLLINEGFALGDVWIAGLSDYAAQQRNFPQLVPNLDAAECDSRRRCTSAARVRRREAPPHPAHALCAHARRPVRHPPAPPHARRPLPEVRHRPLPRRRIAALRQHRHRLLAAAVEIGHDAGDHRHRAALSTLKPAATKSESKANAVVICIRSITTKLMWSTKLSVRPRFAHFDAASR
jgi:Calcineurin-like phosphoesterase